MWLVLALLACNGSTSVGDVTPDGTLTPPEAPKKIPAILLADTEPLVMPTGDLRIGDCYGGGDYEKPVAKQPPLARPSASARTGSAPPSSAPVGGTGTGLSGKGGGGGGAGEGYADLGSLSAGGAMPETSASTADASAPPSPDPAPPPRAAREDAGGASKPTSEPKKEATTTRTRPKPPRDQAPIEEIVEAEPVEQAAVSTPAAQLDWGAKVYLSNDDSMSLASAQHLLHAVDKGHSFSASAIRPHELLNYFSFDTAPIGEGELFSAQGVGEKTGDDTLTFAFAIKGATPPRKPLDLTVVVDRSGSMTAEGRMTYTKRALNLMTEQLVAGDRVDLVLFDNAVCTAVENFVVGRDDMSQLKRQIDKLQPEGGTNISVGLKEAYRLVSQEGRDQGTRRNRRVMLVTDAGANQGVIDKDVLAQVADAYESKGVRVTGVGVGVGFRDDLLDEVTEKGKGAYVYLGSEAVVDRLFGVGFQGMTQTIAHDVQFELALPPTLAMKRFYGEEASTVAADIQPIHYYAGTSQLFLQDLGVKASELSPDDPLVLTVRYRDAATGEPGEQVFSWTVGGLMGGDKHNLAKARTLMAWTDLLSAKAMGGSPCGAPLATYQDRASAVSGDAEIAYVSTLVAKQCPTLKVPPPPVLASTVAYKVRVDSDIPIAEVELFCAGKRLEQKLSGSDTVARFDAVPGACELTLQGNVPMQASVKVPSVGGDIKCLVRSGRVSCG